MKQGSAEWLAIRCGKVTASRVADVIARTKSGWGASRATYMGELIAERLTGVPAPSYTNASMQWGTDTEPQARAAYEFRTDAAVEEIGFIEHPRVAMSGASPDGLVANDGLLELKCPNTSTHIDTLLGQEAPAKYIAQIQWQMACADRKWCDFVSFDPRMPEPMRLYIKRIVRNDNMIADLERDVSEFLRELDAKVASLIKVYQEAA